ncbi:hypothetical protein QBC43DRAFT_293033, partial [Cladorrhinum sp. PSN259]
MRTSLSLMLQSRGIDTIQDQLENIQHDLKSLNQVKAPAWVDSPNTRGTADILFSCMLTLFACVYTALHLNIPERNATTFQLFTRKLKWVFVALVAPEVVLWFAADQYFTARKISQHLRLVEREKYGTVNVHKRGRLMRYLRVLMCRGSEEKPNHEEAGRGGTVTGSDQRIFDLKYGFFVAMGGLELVLPGGESNILSYDGVKWLASEDVGLLRISRSRILDQSKADTLQKAVVLFQVGWMALQCIARKIYGLPLSLLELHTMVHVVCAILMYAFWLEKPLDIRSAESIHLPPELAKKLLRLKDSTVSFYVKRSNLPGFDTSWVYRFQLGDIFEYIRSRRSLSIVAVTLPILYGGIHLSAWNFEFPTHVEATLWKVACIVITSTTPCFALISFLLGYFDDPSLDIFEPVIISIAAILFFLLPL